jgi:hypothetical protein
MEAPVSICTKEEMRGAIRFFFAGGVKPVEIIRRMQAQYVGKCSSRSKIYEWIDHFRKGRTSVCDEERSGRPLTSRTENNSQAFGRMVQENGLQWMSLRRLPYSWTNERSFSSDGEVTDAVQNWLKTRPKIFFSDGIKKNCETLQPVR